MGSPQALVAQWGNRGPHENLPGVPMRTCFEMGLIIMGLKGTSELRLTFAEYHEAN